MYLAACIAKNKNENYGLVVYSQLFSWLRWTKGLYWIDSDPISINGKNHDLQTHTDMKPIIMYKHLPR